MGTAKLNYAAVAIDGIDGSGKTTVADTLESRFKSMGQTVHRADRAGPSASAAVANLTSLIKASDGGSEPLSEQSDALVRLARAWQRWATVQTSNADISLIDRWMITDLARISDSVYVSQRPLIVELLESTAPVLTVLLEAPFDVTWARVMRRPSTELSPKERLGRAHNLALHDRVAIGVSRFEECGGAVHRISNADGNTVDDTVDSVLSKFTSGG